MEKEDFKVLFFEWRDNESLYKYTLGLHYLTSALREQGFKVKDKIFERDSVEEVVE